MARGYGKEQKQVHKQMGGCMAGFLQIFDRHHKRLLRLPVSPPPTSDSGISPPSKSHSSLSVFQSKHCATPPWKETPRLSLDSRATTAADGSHHNRSPSVIARLMGLEPLPGNQPELRRSASESRDLFQSTDSTSLYSTHPDNATINPNYADPRNQSSKKGVKSKGLNRGGPNPTSSRRAPQPRRNFYDSGDVFPEPKQNVSSIYSEIDKRLKMRGIDEPSKDLETLKHILEALQLKGLLHSKPPLPLPQHNQYYHRNFVYDESPIVTLKPSPPNPINRIRNDYSQPNVRKQIGEVRRNLILSGEISASPSPRRERNVRSPTLSARSTYGSNSPVKTKQPSTHRRVNESADRKASPVRPNRSPRSKKPPVVITQKGSIPTVAAAEDSHSSVSGSSVKTSTDTERRKAEEFKEGKCFLERCDKLLHIIAEFAATDMQPSPVSVLDSSLLTPSPVTTKRNIDFEDEYGESSEEVPSPAVSPIRSKFLDTSDACDFAYIVDILRASHYLPAEPDVFMLLEKQQHLKGNDNSIVSKLQRRLIFDTINEIKDRDAQLPPWRAIASMNHNNNPLLDKVWTAFQRMRECEVGEDLFETICRVLKKDLAGDAVTGWGHCPVEVSDVVLDIEHLVFKNMVCEIMEDLSLSASPFSMMTPRRKLLFF